MGRWPRSPRSPRSRCRSAEEPRCRPRVWPAGALSKSRPARTRHRSKKAAGALPGGLERRPRHSPSERDRFCCTRWCLVAWELRPSGRRYYYRARRVRGRVVKEYVGGGQLAVHASRTDGARRDRAAQERAELLERLRQLDATHAPVDKALRALEEATDAQLHAAYEAAGFHRHCRGEWRRKRGRTNR